ncbi:DUF3291 domain-containing protein [Nonomuraea salmonea]|uniref:DUF3291 domain-containing protein n=1 Tax=Nonomuraea salmonea TaxID=46181 RepID=UPI003CD05DFA
MHLAQLNIAHLRAPIDSAELAEFVALLEPINALADAAPPASSGGSRRVRPTPPPPSCTTTATCC